MHDDLKRARLWWTAVLVCTAMACGDRLIIDPSFELWCGKKLCAPWESHGKIERVATWHERDYGVSLSDGAEISQLSEHAPVQCIEFTLIADVAAEAEVKLELDFMDDGTSEYEQAIAESHWARLRFLVPAPSWYHGVRFRVRKLGHGHAVLAQLAATSSSDCKGKPVELDHRPAGGRCDDADQCESALCDAIPQRFVLDGQPPVDPAQVCSGCAHDEDCAEGEVCGVTETDYGLARACAAAGSAELGALCESDAACASGRCLRGLPFNTATCGECERDDECGEGEVCGVEALAGGPARVCKAQEPLALGDLCGTNAQCESGVCCFGACSECCLDFFPCPSGQACGSSYSGSASHALLCGSGNRDREAGAPCDNGIDCASDRCKLPDSECLLPGDEESGDLFESACRVSRQIAGVCR